MYIFEVQDPIDIYIYAFLSFIGFFHVNPTNCPGVIFNIDLEFYSVIFGIFNASVAVEIMRYCHVLLQLHFCM